MELEADEPEKALAHFAEAMALRAKLGLPMGSSQQNHAETLMALGRFDEALTESSAAVDDFRTHGMRQGENEARAVLTRVLLARGEVRKALDSCDTGLALARELKNGESDYTAVCLRATYLAGRHDEALAAAAKAHSDAPTVEWDLRLVEGELLLRAGRHDQALRELQVLSTETHAGGYLRVAHMVEALLAGKLDKGYR